MFVMCDFYNKFISLSRNTFELNAKFAHYIYSKQNHDGHALRKIFIKKLIIQVYLNIIHMALNKTAVNFTIILFNIIVFA
jgi:hypothetical protein